MDACAADDLVSDLDLAAPAFVDVVHARPSARFTRRGLNGIRGRARPIVTVRDTKAQVLRRRCRPVPAVDRRIRQLIADMILSMRRAGGIGLAAPQIGVPLRVVVADIGAGPLAIVNPRFRRREGAAVGIEGCLSIPGVYGDVERAQRIEVEGRNVRGRRVVIRSRDLLARVFQHEIDHLNGVLFTDPGRLIRLRRPRRRARRGHRSTPRGRDVLVPGTVASTRGAAAPPRPATLPRGPS